MSDLDFSEIERDLRKSLATSHEDDRLLKLEWASKISILLVVIVSFFIVFTILIGQGKLCYEGCPQYPIVAVIGFISSLIALPWIVLSHLFNKHKNIN